MLCTVDGCEKIAQREGLCWTHRRRKQRNKALETPLQPRYPSPWTRLIETAIALADCDVENDEQYERLKHRFRMSAKNYVFNLLHSKKRL